MPFKYKLIVIEEKSQKLNGILPPKDQPHKLNYNYLKWKSLENANGRIGTH
jgi:hypothetical protein